MIVIAEKVKHVNIGENAQNKAGKPTDEGKPIRNDNGQEKPVRGRKKAV